MEKPGHHATGRLASIPNRLSPKAFTMACENIGVDMKATEIVKKRFAIGTMAVLAGAAVLEAALGRYRGRWDRIRGGLQGLKTVRQNTGLHPNTAVGSED